MGREVDPHQYIEKWKYLNELDEAFGFMCIHISRKLLFRLEGLKNLKPNNLKQVWDKLESLFREKEELRGHILENELVALQPSNFDTI